jgi:quinol monooxygenase YgiN
MLILVKVRVKDGSQAAFEQLVAGLSEVVKATEPGTLVYTLGKIEGAKTDYWMIEHYASQAAHDAHVNSAHFKAAMPKIGPLLDGAPEMVKFERVV